jgi:hypothetical protein
MTIAIFLLHLELGDWEEHHIQPIRHKEQLKKILNGPIARGV